MKSFARVLVGAAVVGFAAGENVTPVQKVIQLLQNMLTKGQEEKHAEQVQFAAFKQFCDDTSTEKKRSIKEAEETIEVLKADIGKYTSDASQLTKEIAGHDEDVSVWTGDKKAATKVREIEKTDYDAMHKDYSESVDALQRAIAVLSKMSHDRKQSASLLQVSALKDLALIPESAKRALDAFLQQDPEGLEVSAPEAAGYEFQSHGVIEMLEKLLDEFVAERTKLEKEEMNGKHAYDMLMQDLTAQVEQSETDRSEKSESKAKKLQAKADAEGSLSDTSSTKDDDVKYLTDLTSTCGQKASDFEERQQLRTEEIEAIGKAVGILSSGAVAGNAEKHLPSLAQKGTSLVQLRGLAASQPQQRAADFLLAQGRRLDSRVLSALAVRVSDDPFSKVKKMIKDLIVRLMEEANEEAEHKGWCDKELATNEHTRKEKTDSVETLRAEIDELTSSIAKLTEDVAELSKEVAELDEAVSKATSFREDEKAKNTQTIQDAMAAQSAVAQALTVLKDFYAKASEATAFVQQQPEAPEIFDKPYRGMGGESGGVVGMLEVIESDFARLETDTKSSEVTAQTEYDAFMSDSKVDKASKTKDIEHKTAKKQDESEAIVTKKEDLEGTEKELDAALDYFDKLKPSCVDAGVSQEDRGARRKEEIESLQEALRILNGEDLP